MEIKFKSDRPNICHLSQEARSINLDEYFKTAIINFGYENSLNFGKPVYAL